jgi:hypothetical protein
MKFFSKFFRFNENLPYKYDPLKEKQLLEVLKSALSEPNQNNLPENYLLPDNKYVVVDSTNYGLMQRKYMDEDWTLKPNVSLFQESGDFYFQVNEVGLKGSRLDSSRRQVAVWGDSVVFGIGRGWVDLASDKSILFLNGGAEGAPATAILNNSLEKNSKVSFDMNIFSLGWHSKYDTKLVRRVLEESLKLPNLAFMTLPYSISLDLAKRDLTSQFSINKDLSEAYLFWGNHDYSVATASRLVREIMNQNKIMRKFAKKKGIPILDFEEILVSERNAKTFKRSFFDLGHPRPAIYPFLASKLREFAKVHL